MGTFVVSHRIYNPLEVCIVFLQSEEFLFVFGFTLSYESIGTGGFGAIHFVW